MITNERQYKITKSQLKKFEEAINKFDIQDVTNRVGSEILANVELQALESEVEILRDQLSEYETLQSGAIATFESTSLDELPELLIRARIAQHLSQKELADLVGVKEQQIQRYESEEYASASLKRLRLIAKVLNLNITETAEISPISTDRNHDKSSDLNWNFFPVNEMYRRGWFEGFFGSLREARLEADILVQNFVLQVLQKPEMVSLHRKSVRTGSILDQYALLAWECRILHLATKNQPNKKFIITAINSEWISELIKVSREDNGPKIAKDKLQEIGIPLIIEPHLPNTYLDGAAILNGENPVIGMTLRYDRLDNFWFALIHELIHIWKHLKKGELYTIFDDLEFLSRDHIEQEADSLTREALIPSNIWETSLARYVRTNQTIKDFAEEHEVHPAIIAGRIRYESQNYWLFPDLIGQGEVRKHFPGINFGS